jgi:gas vesicle protein
VAERGAQAPFWAGLLAGTAAGAVVALLLAPWSGEETRDVLRAKSREASNLARDTAADALEGIRKTLEGAIAEGKTAAQRRRDELEAELRPEPE